MLAEYNICNQPKMSIKEVRIITINGNDSLISKISTGVLQMMKSISNYSALFSVGFQIITVSFQTKHNVIGMYWNL